MTNLEGMHSYFWLTSSRLKEPVQDDVPYTTRALRQDLLRVRNAWEECQASRKRDAIYIYLTAVFDLVAWWAAEGRALERAHKALWLQRMCPFDDEEPFAAVIRCTADLGKVDKRTRSKWSRVLRYALACKSNSEPLDSSSSAKAALTNVLAGLLVASGDAGNIQRRIAFPVYAWNPGV
jgi:hypothetical protein